MDKQTIDTIKSCIDQHRITIEELKRKRSEIYAQGLDRLAETITGQIIYEQEAISQLVRRLSSDS